MVVFGVEVYFVGFNWVECNVYFYDEFLLKDLGGIYVLLFDYEDVWVGVVILVDEVRI